MLHADDPADEPWNASDYAHHLSRRARGLPFWFSLATYGTDAYTEAVETTLQRHPRGAPDSIAATPHTELVMEPELSIVLFRRVGWSAADYQAWSDAELAIGTVVRRARPRGTARCVLRFCIVNPLTTVDDIATDRRLARPPTGPRR